MIQVMIIRQLLRDRTVVQVLAAQTCGTTSRRLKKWTVMIILAPAFLLAGSLAHLLDCI
jgi:hypothetical protein